MFVRGGNIQSLSYLELQEGERFTRSLDKRYKKIVCSSFDFHGIGNDTSVADGS